MIKLLFFITYILKILSYIPIQYNITPTNQDYQDYYIQNTCTCDLTYKICDRNCCCDPDCDFSNYGYFEDFFEECVESNVILPNSFNAIPICSSERFVIGDLYNPLNAGYQILKKGMCLKDEYKSFDTNEIKDPENKINKSKEFERNEQIDNENIEKFFKGTTGGNGISNLIFPVMAPSGMCMKGYPISFLEDKTVICSIQGNNVSDFNKKVNYYINPTNNMITNFKLYENNTYESRSGINDTNIIKKIIINIEINEQNDLNFCNNNNQCKYHYYYRNISENNTRIISDVTFVIKFFVFDSEFNVLVPKKSGNPGYIIGSPIKFGQVNQNYIYPFYRNRLFLGLHSSQNICILNNEVGDNDNFYENDILSNSITFENRTLFTCLRSNSTVSADSTLIINLINKYFSNPIKILQYGNSMISDLNSIVDVSCNYNSNENYIIVQIFYQFLGLKQNPQRNIKTVRCLSHSINNDNAIYVEFLFISLNNEVKKEEVPAPIIIKWPHNWLYPFRIGTTNYEEK